MLLEAAVDPQRLSAILDRAYFATALEGLKKGFLRDYFTAWIDLINIRTVLRCLLYTSRAHLVICMEQGQAEVLRDAFEEADLDRKIYSFREFFGGSTKDIPDPYGGDEQVYENCAVLLEKYIKKFVKKILMQE